MIAGAILMQAGCGVIFAWEAFVPKLCDKAGKYVFTVEQAQWILSVGLLMSAGAAVMSGKLMNRLSPRVLALASGLMLGAGYILGGFLGDSFVRQLIFIGVIGGSGIGLGYIIPIVVGIKWFPDNKGLIAGLTVTGFGFGSLIWMRAAGSWLDLINSLSLFGLDGVRSVFVLYGAISFVLILLGSVGMFKPPSGSTYGGAGFSSISEAGVGSVNFEPLELFKAPQFAMIWVAFFCSIVAGVIVTGLTGSFGFHALRASGLENPIATEAAKWAMASLVILYGLGCIVWGCISDTVGRKGSIFVMCLVQGATMLLFCKMGSDPKFLILGACIIGLNFGGNFALFPAITADYFGDKNVGLNYGCVLLAYGIAGVVGVQIALWFQNRIASGGVDPSLWLCPFVIAGICSLIGAGIAFFFKAPNRPGS